jgi:hypothetical protein
VDTTEGQLTTVLFLLLTGLNEYVAAESLLVPLVYVEFEVLVPVLSV